MKRFALFAAVLLAALAVFALDNIAPPASIYDGDTHAAKSIGTATVTNLVTPAMAATPTNGATLTLSGSYMAVTPIGGANNTTNTVTLAAPGTAGVGKVVYIVVGASATNWLGIADSGTAALSAAFIGHPGDSLTLIGSATGTWTQVSTSDN